VKRNFLIDFFKRKCGFPQLIRRFAPSSPPSGRRAIHIYPLNNLEKTRRDDKVMILPKFDHFLDATNKSWHVGGEDE
jgi:hypothetical protein